MKKILFDTDVLIDILRNKKTTVEQVRKLAQDYEEFCCCCVTIGEIFAGMSPQEEGSTRNLLGGLSKISIGEDIAELGGRMKYKIKNQDLFLDDCLIAAAAMINDCILATKNVKHYPFLGMEVLKIE